MRIGLVVSGGLDRSGRERVVPILLWLVERLARRHDVHAFVLHYYPEPCTYPLRGATVHDLGRAGGPPGLRRLQQQRRLAAAVAAAGPFALLHAHQGIAVVVASTVARRMRLPFIASLDSGELTAIDDIRYGLQRRWFDRRAVSAAIGAAARVTVATNFMARLVPDGLCATPPAVIPIGIDTAAFPPGPRTDGPPWRLLRVASLNPVKDYPALLQALALLVQRGLDVHLDIVGEDTMDGSVQARAAELRVDAHVTFHGFQPTDRLAAFFGRAHLHVVSSRHEAAGVVVLEAAAAGVATVGTAVGHVADWSPERAVAVPVGNPDALAIAIEELLMDAPRRARLAAAAREWTLAHDADWTAAQFSQLYADVAGRVQSG
jgi:glycosyltransferase involved in cell wall biosynthesis